MGRLHPTFGVRPTPSVKTDGELRSVQVFETTGANTYIPPKGLKRIVAEVQAGGGGGGGCANPAASEAAEGGGGGGGGYTRELLEASALSDTETATVGVGGAGGAAGDNNGVAGGTSSFGAFCSATGGGFGDGAPSSAANGGVAGGIGGIGSNGDINIKGNGGNRGEVHSAEITRLALGGSSHLGGGAIAPDRAAGNAGGVYGGGGSGANERNAGGAKAGGAGADGIVIVWEYF